MAYQSLPLPRITSLKKKDKKNATAHGRCLMLTNEQIYKAGYDFLSAMSACALGGWKTPKGAACYFKGANGVGKFMQGLANGKLRANEVLEEYGTNANEVYAVNAEGLRMVCGDLIKDDEIAATTTSPTTHTTPKSDDFEDILPDRFYALVDTNNRYVTSPVLGSTLKKLFDISLMPVDGFLYEYKSKDDCYANREPERKIHITKEWLAWFYFIHYDESFSIS